MWLRRVFRPSLLSLKPFQSLPHPWFALAGSGYRIGRPESARGAGGRNGDYGLGAITAVCLAVVLIVATILMARRQERR